MSNDLVYVYVGHTYYYHASEPTTHASKKGPYGSHEGQYNIYILIYSLTDWLLVASGIDKDHFLFHYAS